MKWPVVLVCAAVAAGCNIQVGEKGITSVGITEGRATDEWVRTYTLKPGGTLEIVNVNGRIEATVNPGNQVEVHAERIVRDHAPETADAELKQVQMREDVSADRVRIEAQPPRAEGLLDHSSLTVNYRIRVPAGVGIDVRTGNGGIRLDSLNGPVMASTTNGDINGQLLTGDVSLKVTNGNLRLDLVSLGGDVDVETTNGGMRLNLPTGIKATLDAACVNGGIAVDDDLMLQVSESSQCRTTGTFNGGGPRIHAATVNGSIRIRNRAAGRQD